MPNYSSCSFDMIDWTMGFDGYHSVKKRDLLQNLRVTSENHSSTPTPPPFENFITLVNTKARTSTCSSLSSISSDGSAQLPHQTPSPLLNRTNYQYSKIRARPIYNFNYNETSIWTQSSPNSMDSFLSNLSSDGNVVKKFFAKETKLKQEFTQTRSRSPSLAQVSISRPYRILDKSAQISYDVTMRHLLQLLNKDQNRCVNLDDVLHAIESDSIPSEWLQCVQRLTKTFHKEVERRPEIRMKLENFNQDDLESLNIVEQFFLKLLQLPNYNFKLKSYQYREEFQSQLHLLHRSIEQLLHGIELVRHHQHLPWIFQLLCFLYNLVSDKSVPGLDLISLADALNSPTNQMNKTVSHVLAQILDEYYPEHLLKIINDEELIQLKKIAAIKYEKIFSEIRDIYQQYEELEYEYFQIKTKQGDVPAFIQSMLKESKSIFEQVFRQEEVIRKGEADLAAYFCSSDLSLDACLSSVGQFVNKLRQAHSDNKHSKKTSKFR